MENFKKALAEEAPFKLSEEVMDKFCGIMEEKRIKKREVLIQSGEFNDNIYIVKEGILRRSHMDGDKEVTVAFALAGTVIMSYHSYCYRLPAYSQFDACCDSVVMVVSKSKFEKLTEESHEFALWALNMSHCQLYYNEVKQALINGSAIERYRSLLKNRPEILEKVSLKIIASYLGVTNAYLSRMRKQFAKMD